VIDDTAQADARVPERFMSVQWLRVPGGEATPALKALCTRLVTGEAAAPPPAKRPPLVGKARAKAAPDEKPAGRPLPAFPEEEPGKKAKYYFLAAEWLVKAAWIKFQALPRFIRLLVYIWLAFLILSGGRSTSHAVKSERSGDTDAAVAAARKAVTAAQVAKLKVLAEGFDEGANKGDLTKFGAEVAREFAGDAGDTGEPGKPGEKAAAKTPILAIRFTAPAESPAEVKVADSTFALLYGRLSIAGPGKVGLGRVNLSPGLTLDAVSAQALGKANNSDYVVYGAVETKGADRVLTVKVEEVDGAGIVWSKSYPIATADPEAIAPEIEKAIAKQDAD
jgi:hypothetical protein